MSKVQGCREAIDRSSTEDEINEIQGSKPHQRLAALPLHFSQFPPSSFTRYAKDKIARVGVKGMRDIVISYFVLHTLLPLLSFAASRFTDSSLQQRATHHQIITAQQPFTCKPVTRTTLVIRPAIKRESAASKRLKPFHPQHTHLQTTRLHTQTCHNHLVQKTAPSRRLLPNQSISTSKSPTTTTRCSSRSSAQLN
jgi:hypothetical protein